MRIFAMLMLALLLACSKTEVSQPEGEVVNPVAGADADSAQVDFGEEPLRPKLPPSVTSVPTRLVAVGGFAGPVTAMSGAWGRQLQNCIEVQTALPRGKYDGLSATEKEAWAMLHKDIAKQWDGDKRGEPEPCASRFGSIPTLAECTFDLSLGSANSERMEPESRALIEQYGVDAVVRFHYWYFNPKTAIDDTGFRDRCQAIPGGQWKAVGVDSEAYATAAKLYEEQAPITVQDPPPMAPQNRPF
ncbi:MAG: hypothetical protein AAF500_14910 [Myxococcota bacterium]